MWIAPAGGDLSPEGLAALSREHILWTKMLMDGTPGRSRPHRPLGVPEKFWCFPQMPGSDPRSAFHLHLISDATGETLTTMAKAAAVQYPQVRAIEHIHPLVRTERQLDRVLDEVGRAPGIVLYTLVKKPMIREIERRCRELNVPCLHVLQPIMKVFESYLGAPQTPVVAGQHTLDADYFRRIDALNFAMAHDDGQLPQDLSLADIILVGISRTSKTPTTIYLAQRGYKTANVPLVPGVDLPAALTEPHTAFVVGLVASAERIAEIRRNRVYMMGDRNLTDYIDHAQIANEIQHSRRLCARHGWPVIDVTRRSVEETAASIIRLFQDRHERVRPGEEGQIGDG
jgi:regulator of PEP synthase PpsR (kinase-PPPase family)